MNYELGDRVRIKKHWKKQSQTEQLEKMGITKLEDHLKSDEMAGDYIHLDKFKKNQSKKLVISAELESLRLAMI